MRRSLIKTLIFTAVVPGTVVVAVPRWLLSSRGGAEIPFVPSRLGAPVLALGAAVYLWCAWDFAVAGRGTPAPIDPPKALVARGLYRFVRNPMYLGISAILVGEALLWRSGALLEYAAVVFAFFFLFVVAYEEPALRRKFGQAYEQYCRQVPRWIPRSPPRSKASRSNS